MKRLNLVLVLLFISTSLFSCAESEHKAVSFTMDKDIVITSDLHNTYIRRVFRMSDSVIAVATLHSNSVYYYNLNTLKEISKHKYNGKLDYCIPGADGYSFFCNYGYTYMETDTNYNLKHYVNLYDYAKTALHYEVFMFEKYKNKAADYLVISMFKDPFSLKNDCFSILKRDGGGNISYTEFGPRPKELQNPNCLVMWHNCVVYNDYIYVLFDKCLKVFKYDLNGNLKDTYPIKSDYVKSFPRYEPSRAADHNYNINYQLNSGCCADIRFDEYRKLFYITLLHAYNKKNDDGGEDAPSQTWSIIICDENFHQLKEVFMDSKKYFNHVAGPLIAPDGVYFPNISKAKADDIYKGNLVLTKFNVEVKNVK